VSKQLSLIDQLREAAQDRDEDVLRDLLRNYQDIEEAKDALWGMMCSQGPRLRLPADHIGAVPRFTGSLRV
jgi:hypothetical protein